MRLCRILATVWPWISLWSGPDLTTLLRSYDCVRKPSTGCSPEESTSGITVR